MLDTKVYVMGIYITRDILDTKLWVGVKNMSREN